MSPIPWHELPPTAGLPLRWRDFAPMQATDLASQLASQIGAAQALLTCSGTAALIVALRTLALASDRREVIVPAFTCPLVILAVTHCGLVPRLCDLLPGRFDMDPHVLSAVCGSQTLAIVPTHLAGRVADLAPLLPIAQRTGAYVIEDAAQAFGGRHGDGRALGLVGDVGFFSLAAGKGLTLYEGGLLVARDPALLAAMQETATQLLVRDWRREWQRSLQLLGYAALYRPGALRWPYGGPLRAGLRRGDVAAALGDVFTPDIPLHRVSRWRQSVGARAAARWPAFRQALQAQAQARLPRLRRLPGVQVLDDPGAACGTWPVLVLHLSDRLRRDALLDRLWTSGLGVSRLFAYALPDYPYLRAQLPDDAVTNARAFAARTMTLSNSLWLDESSFARLLAVFEQVLHALPTALPLSMAKG